MLMILYILLTIIMLILVYGVLPTAIMRMFSLGIFRSADAQGKVALTFDDGPHPVYTPRLLDLLKRYRIKATFFVVGEYAEQYPHIIKRMAEEGHEVAIHHYRHVSNWLLTPFGTKRQCAKTAAVIRRITGREPVDYRPPWGHLNLAVFWARRPFRLVIWSAILGDWKRTLGKERLLKRLHEGLRDGAIIVLHDNDRTPGADEGAPLIMLEALEAFLADVHDQYDFVTVDRLAAVDRRAGNM